MASSALVITQGVFARWRHIPNPLKMSSSMPNCAHTLCVLIHSGFPEIKKRGSCNSFALLTTPVIIAAVVVSFSDPLPGSNSAVPHRRIPRFALQSDNPASLFLIFCTRCKRSFFRITVWQILHSGLLPSESFHPAVLKMLPSLLYEVRFHHDELHKISCCSRIFGRRYRYPWSWNN